MIQKFFAALYANQVALIKKDKKGLYIEQLLTIPPDVKPLDMLSAAFPKRYFEIVTGLESSDVLLRSLSLSLKSKREIRKALPFQVENLFSQTEELLLLPTLYPQKEGTEIFLIASTQSALKRHLSTWYLNDLDSDIVSCVPLALFRFARYFLPAYPSLFFYYQHGPSATFLVINDGRLQASQALKIQDFERTLAFMKKKYPAIQHILATEIETLQAPLIPLEIENPAWLANAIPIGLALDAASEDSQKGQFRQLPSEKHLRRKKKQMKRFLTAAVSFFLITTLMGHFHLRQREKAILASIDAPKGLRLKEAVAHMEQSIAEQKKIAVPIPNIPKVHEVLFWLSQHPKLTNECAVTHLRYQLIKAPHIGKAQQPYAVSVELELNTDDARAARAFHQALLTDEKMVDQNNEVKWRADHGIYHASFYLKPLLLVQ